MTQPHSLDTSSASARGILGIWWSTNFSFLLFESLSCLLFVLQSSLRPSLFFYFFLRPFRDSLPLSTLSTSLLSFYLSLLRRSDHQFFALRPREIDLGRPVDANIIYIFIYIYIYIYTDIYIRMQEQRKFHAHTLERRPESTAKVTAVAATQVRPIAHYRFKLACGWQIANRSRTILLQVLMRPEFFMLL